MHHQETKETETCVRFTNKLTLARILVTGFSLYRGCDPGAVGGGLAECVRECSGSRQTVLEEKSEKNGNPGPFARFIDSRILTVFGLNSTFHETDIHICHEVRCKIYLVHDTS